MKKAAQTTASAFQRSGSGCGEVMRPILRHRSRSLVAEVATARVRPSRRLRPRPPPAPRRLAVSRPAGRSPRSLRRAPAAAPSANGKNASLASTAPCVSWPSSRAFSTAIRTASTRLICPAPIPIVCRPRASTIAFDETCLQTRQAKRTSSHASSATSPQATLIVSRSCVSASRSCTSRPPRTRLKSRSPGVSLRRSPSCRMRSACFARQRLERVGCVPGREQHLDEVLRDPLAERRR